MHRYNLFVDRLPLPLQISPFTPVQEKAHLPHKPPFPSVLVRKCNIYSMARPATATPATAISLLQLSRLAAPVKGAGEVAAGAPVVNVPLADGTGTPLEMITTGVAAVVRGGATVGSGVTEAAGVTIAAPEVGTWIWPSAI